MEAWTCSFCRTATLRRRPGPGGANRRQPTWPLAARKQPRAYQGTAKQLLRFTRPGFRRGTAVRIIRRTAVYGPVRTVVWEGRSREAPPYPDFQRHAGGQVRVRIRIMKLSKLNSATCIHARESLR